MAPRLQRKQAGSRAGVLSHSLAFSSSLPPHPLSLPSFPVLKIQAYPIHIALKPAFFHLNYVLLSSLIHINDALHFRCINISDRAWYSAAQPNII